MVNKPINQKSVRGPLPLDESWWTAVLAEEESRASAGSRGAASSHGEGGPASKPGAKTTTKQNVKQTAPYVATKMAPVNWTRAQDVYDEDETLCLEVIGHNRGGLLVEGDGLQGFVPLSHLVDLTLDKLDLENSNQDLSPLLAEYVGRMLTLKVIECDPERGRIVLSERAALAEPGRRNELLDTLKHGDCVRGTVTNVTDFGVFVDLGGVEGLIHVSELSWGRVRHPSDAASVGQYVEAYVIQVDKDRSRVALSLKRLRPNPWDTAEVRYQPGQVIEAVVTSVVAYGAFARLEEGLDGLIHISEMSLSGEKVDPHEVVHEGEQVLVRVLQVDASRQRLGLSLYSDNETE
jgi:small subunit ribosomal protein S1